MLWLSIKKMESLIYMTLDKFSKPVKELDVKILYLMLIG